LPLLTNLYFYDIIIVKKKIVKGVIPMKRLSLILSIVCLTLLLCSCKVNLITTTADVPWYVIAIPVVIIFVAAYFILMNTTFACPDCKTEFKPKWYQLSVTVHFMGKRLAQCPNRKRKGFFKKK
jgi:hypothetical protein